MMASVSFTRYQKILTLQNSFDTTRPIGDFIRTFEQEWTKLLLLTSNSGTVVVSKYRTLMKQVLEQDKAKRDLLLAALVAHHPNLVDNMTTKDNLTFSQLEVRLHSLSSNVDSRTARTANTALVAHGKKRKFDRRVRTSSNSATPISISGQSCTWCKARNFRHECHVWQECRKLKASNMTNEIGQFERLTPHHGTIRVGGNSTLRSEGIETVVLPTHPVCVRLCNVLHLPSLGHSLLSWNQLKHKLRLSGQGQYMTVTTIDNSPIFTIKFRGSLPYVVLNTSVIAQASAHPKAPSVTRMQQAQYWHSSLGHPSRITAAAYATDTCYQACRRYLSVNLAV